MASKVAAIKRGSSAATAAKRHHLSAGENRSMAYQRSSVASESSYRVAKTRGVSAQQQPRIISGSSVAARNKMAYNLTAAMAKYQRQRDNIDQRNNGDSISIARKHRAPVAST